MNIYLISRTDSYGYDEYSDAVVVAKSEEEARKIHPSDLVEGDSWTAEENYGSWISPDKVEVTLIGKATKGIGKGIVCASFHAG